VTNHDKQQAALELVRLRRLLSRAGLRDNAPAQIKQLRERHLEQLQAVMAQLYAEHFSDEQLQALLDFYESDLGKAIIETESEISKQFQERVKELAAQLNEEASKAGGPISSFLEGPRRGSGSR
jgi:hypothetical protein